MAADGIEFIISAADATGGAFSSAASKMGNFGSVTAKAAAAITGAATAVFGFTAVVAKSIEKVADYAEKLKQPVDQFSKYQAIADAANISTEAFNMSMQQLMLSTEKATKAIGEDSRAFAQLGINASQFKNMNLDQKMELLADRISSVTNAEERLTIATTLFGARGTDMLKMLGENSEALRKAAQDAQFLGLVIGPQMAANSKQFGDSFDRAAGSLKGVSMAVANELMPLLSGLMDRFATSMANNREAIAGFVKSAILSLFTFIEITKQVFEGIYKLFTDREAQITFLKNIAMLIPQVGAVSIAIGKAFFIGLWEGIKLIITGFAAFASWFGQSVAGLLKGEGIADFSAQFSDVFFKAFDDAKDRIAGVMAEVGDVAVQSMGDIGAGMSEAFGVNLEDANAKAQAAIEGLSLYGKAASDTITETGATLSPMMQALHDQQSLFIEGLQNNTLTFFETLRTTAETAINSISNGMAQAIMQGQSIMAVFKNVAAQVLQSIIAAMIKMGIQRLILSKMDTGATRMEASAAASKAVGLAGANMFASMAATPFPLNLTAPAMAIAASAGAASTFTAGAATGAALGASLPAAHGGLTNNPNEQTFLLRKGERVLSPNQNSDLTGFMDENSGMNGGGGVSIQNLEIVIMPNATNADAFFDMDQKKLSKLIADPVLMALNDLSRKGIKPDFAQRLP